MKKILLSLLLSLISLNCFAWRVIGYRPEIEPYVKFLQVHNTSAVDYVMQLFDKYDIVILAETDHLETTQWDFFYQIISDQRFIDRVGNVFTETGSVSQQPALEAFFKANSLDRNAILQMMHNFMPSPEGWDRNNYYDFLQRMYKLNKTLTTDKKINLFFSDEPATWAQFPDHYQYKIFYDLPGEGEYINPRDRIMAMRIFTKYQTILSFSAPRKKALVIMNSRHAFGPIKELDDPKWGYIGQNVGGFLIRWLPNKVANVMLNTAGSTTQHLLQSGKWDAAFRFLNNPAVGFDFVGSPFGADSFDYGQAPSNYQYKDIFTGMVFFKPLSQHWLHDDIPGYYDKDYQILVMQRAGIVCDPDDPVKYQECLNEVNDQMQDVLKHPENHNKPLYSETLFQQMKYWLYYDI